MSTNDIIQKRSAGGVVHSNGKFLTLNVTNYSEIVFPKGTIEPDETPEQAAVREILEETGYHVRIIAPLGEVSYEFDEDDGKRYKKTVHHFLFELMDEDEQPKPNREDHEDEEGIENLWLTENDAFARLTHENSKDVLRKALAIIP
jgi:8-oxo-dGTP pyrophosphatase MutT (NUDIX family)